VAIDSGSTNTAPILAERERQAVPVNRERNRSTGAFGQRALISPTGTFGPVLNEGGA